MPDNSKVQSFLKDWILNHLKNRDLIPKNIESIKDNVIKYKDKEQTILVIPLLTDFTFLESLEKDKHYLLATFNTKNTLNSVIENWKKLIEFKYLSICFINPWSSLDKRWIIYPYTHHKIADESSLKTGLKSMFETVDLLTEKEINKNLDNQN